MGEHQKPFQDLSVDALYPTREEARADISKTFSVKIKSGLADAFELAAREAGLSRSEFTRRALLLAATHPSRLSSVDDLEADYRSIMAGSRWHKNSKGPANKP